MKNYSISGEALNFNKYQKWFSDKIKPEKVIYSSIYLLSEEDVKPEKKWIPELSTFPRECLPTTKIKTT